MTISLRHQKQLKSSFLLANITNKLFTTSELKFPQLRNEKQQSKFADLQRKSMDWFLYDRDLLHERVNVSVTTARLESLKILRPS